MLAIPFLSHSLKIAIMQNEIWTDTSEFPLNYEVSNSGQVRRKKNKTVYKDGRIAYFSETILKYSVNTKGYCRVSLSINSIKYTRSIHRLVATSFLKNPNNKKQVNHIDGNKQNNNVSNLEWATQSENQKHAFDNNLISRKGCSNSQSKISESDVLKIREMSLIPNVGYLQIARKFNLSITHVRNIVTNKYWRHI